MVRPRKRPYKWCLLQWSSALVRLLWLVGVVELTRGDNMRMPRCHYVTNSGQYQFQAGFIFIYLSIYMYLLFSLNKYKSPLVVSSIALVGWRLGNIFRSTRVFSYYTESTNWFAYWYFQSWFYLMYISVLLYIYVF